jgi:hypothetical protein
LGLAYYAVAFLCLSAFKSKKRSTGVRGAREYLRAIRTFLRALIERRTRLPELARAAAPWLALTACMLVLGAIRQLNLQVMLTERIQSEAYVSGWYAERGGPQLRFIAGIGIAGAVLLSGCLILLRKRLADVGMAIAAFSVLPVLLLVRATSHHDVDLILMTPVIGMPPAYWIEMLALALIAAGALLSIRRARPAPERSDGRIVARIDSVEPP